MKPIDQKAQKLLALQAALNGNPELLQAYKAQWGKPYTEAELEERRQYLTSVYGYEASLEEVFTLFGRSVPTGPGASYRLPNGMPIYF
ncbi:hypothetical protein [Spirosoma koreense]